MSTLNIRMFHVEHLVMHLGVSVSSRSDHLIDQLRSLTIQIGLKVSVLALFGVLVACSKPNPTPELTDPIYNDLVARSAAAKAAAETTKEEIKGKRKELEELPPRDPARRKTQEEISSKTRRLMVAEQDALYYEVRAEQRKAYARDEYLKAYYAGKPWPNPEDFKAYQLQRKVSEGPREWNSRVPKTDRYNKKSPEEMKKDLEAKIKASAPAAGH